MQHIVSKSKFKARALEFFRQVEKAGEEFTITDHGRPVVKIVPFSADSKAPLKNLRNSVLKYEDPMESVGRESWNALK